MKAKRFILMFAGIMLAANVMAQVQLSKEASKAQKAVIEYLRSKERAATIDKDDESVNFRDNNVLYWITFDGDYTVAYTLHRNGLNFEKDTLFRANCAVQAVNEVNKKSNIKCFYENKRVKFVLQTYAKEPADFCGGLYAMIKAFKDVEKMYKDAYNESYKRWKDAVDEKAKKDSIANIPVAIKKIGESHISVSTPSFANFDASGKVVSDYDKALRKSECRFIKTRVEVTCPEKGIFKLGVRIIAPDGKPMLPVRGMEYSVTKNFEINKVNKPIQVEIDGYGSDKEGFWKAGEYKVEIYDFEKGDLLKSTSFNIL